MNPPAAQSPLPTLAALRDALTFAVDVLLDLGEGALPSVRMRERGLSTLRHALAGLDALVVSEQPGKRPRPLPAAVATPAVEPAPIIAAPAAEPAPDVPAVVPEPAPVVDDGPPVPSPSSVGADADPVVVVGTERIGGRAAVPGRGGAGWRPLDGEPPQDPPELPLAAPPANDQGYPHEYAEPPVVPCSRQCAASLPLPKIGQRLFCAASRVLYGQWGAYCNAHVRRRRCIAKVGPMVAYTAGTLTSYEMQVEGVGRVFLRSTAELAYINGADSPGTFRKANCCLGPGWAKDGKPCVWLWALADLRPNEELLMHYGGSHWWQPSADDRVNAMPRVRPPRPRLD